MNQSVIKVIKISGTLSLVLTVAGVALAPPRYPAHRGAVAFEAIECGEQTHAHQDGAPQRPLMLTRVTAVSSVWAISSLNLNWTDIS